jgi:DNA damage-binding protein 1
MELSYEPSTSIIPTQLSPEYFTFDPDADQQPRLIPVPPTKDSEFSGGVLVAGGRTLVVYEASPPPAQTKSALKQQRSKRRKSGGETKIIKEEDRKERERLERLRAPRASVAWPWSQLGAWISIEKEKMLLGDVHGRLALLVLDWRLPGVLFLMPLGEVRTILYLICEEPNQSSCSSDFVTNDAELSG